jgi:hypothetical protein
VVFEADGRPTWPIALWTYGKIEVQFQWLRNTQAFRSVESRQELQRKLNSISGVAIPDDTLEKRPSFAISLLRDQQALGQFLEILEWVARRCEQAAAGALPPSPE